MSYILEALKKSEQERHIGHVPDLTMAQEPPPTTRAARWPWVLSAALLANAAIIGLVVWRPWQAPAPAALEAGHDPRPAGAEGDSPMPDAVATMDAPADGTSSMPAAPPAPVAAPPAPIGPAAPIAPEPVARAGAEPRSEEHPPAAVRSPSDWRAETPRWQDLPAEARSRLPVPRFDVHVFAQEPSRRFVLVDLKKYQEGDRLDQGVKLDAILADGVVLSYQGQRYRVDRP